MSKAFFHRRHVFLNYFFSFLSGFLNTVIFIGNFELTFIIRQL